MIAQVHLRMLERQPQINRKESKVAGSSMIPYQGPCKTEIEKNLEPNPVVASIEIVEIEVPVPGHLDNRTNGIALLVAGHCSGLENKPVPCPYQPFA